MFSVTTGWGWALAQLWVWVQGGAGADAVGDQLGKQSRASP